MRWLAVVSHFVNSPAFLVHPYPLTLADLTFLGSPCHPEKYSLQITDKLTSTQDIHKQIDK